MTSELVLGIVLLVVGIILYVVSRQLPPGISTAANIIGIILAIIGLVLIVLAIAGISVGSLAILPTTTLLP